MRSHQEPDPFTAIRSASLSLSLSQLCADNSRDFHWFNSSSI